MLEQLTSVLSAALSRVINRHWLNSLQRILVLVRINVWISFFAVDGRWDTKTARWTAMLECVLIYTYIVARPLLVTSPSRCMTKRTLSLTDAR